MAKIVCNASYLKCDDVRLKSAQMSSRVSTFCDWISVEDARHLILQCPHFECTCKSPYVILIALLGKTEVDAPEEANIEFMITAEKYIYQMYNAISRSRDGIGVLRRGQISKRQSSVISITHATS